MLNEHTSLGVAEIVFYAPVPLLALYLMLIRHGRPRMPWWFLFMFGNFRLASGIVTVLYQRDRANIGLLIAAIITLNVGVIPLLLCTIGFIRVIAALDHADSEKLRKAIIMVRLTFTVGIGLLVAGGVLAGQYNRPSLVHTGGILTKVGYVVIAVTLLAMVPFEAFFWKRRSILCRSSMVVLTTISAAMPFQTIRIVYSLLGIFNDTESRWNALTGSIGAYVGMALVMEYVVVVLYIATGFIIEPIGKKTESADEEGSTSKFVL